jgi:hypothetical protein
MIASSYFMAGPKVPRPDGITQDSQAYAVSSLCGEPITRQP